MLPHWILTVLYVLERGTLDLRKDTTRAPWSRDWTKPAECLLQAVDVSDLFFVVFLFFVVVVFLFGFFCYYKVIYKYIDLTIKFLKRIFFLLAHLYFFHFSFHFIFSFVFQLWKISIMPNIVIYAEIKVITVLYFRILRWIFAFTYLLLAASFRGRHSWVSMLTISRSSSSVSPILCMYSFTKYTNLLRGHPPFHLSGSSIFEIICPSHNYIS